VAADQSALEAHLAANQERRMADYHAFLSIPSISALPAHNADSQRAAEWLARALTKAGVEHVSVEATGGNPIVYGDWLRAGPDAPTVVVYGHYDVQPVDPLDLWDSPPFTPVVKGGRILARGAADDKGQIMIHLAALDALVAVRHGAPVNLKYVFEGEEESGSVHLDGWLEANRERLRANLAVISDTGFFDGNRPAITIGLRGISSFQLDVLGPGGDLHSGQFGGTIENPIFALAAILAQLKGADGRVRVPGFYDDVLPLSEQDHAAFAALPFDEAAYLAETGSPMLHGEPDFSTLERRGGRPTLEINGIWGGFQGEGPKTVLPAKAGAKISCRLVANQDHLEIADILQKHLKQIAPPYVTVETKRLHGGHGALIDVTSKYMQAAARVLEEVFGNPPVYEREGGSIPVVATFKTELGIDSVMLGYGLPDDNLHSPDERFYLPNFYGGIDATIKFLSEIAK
jgi:acetylornithine deacetylase/succinyl-diaminopimelate desuccinylase-like protein